MTLRKIRRSLPLILLLVGPHHLMAVHGLNASDMDKITRPAHLSLEFDPHGGAEVRLSVPKAPQSSDALQDALAAALHCSRSSFGSSGVPNVGFATLANGWSQAERNRYLHQVSEFNQRNISGRCSSVLHRQDGLFEGEIDYTALAAQLIAAGADQLQVSVRFPQTGFQDYTHATLSQFSFPTRGYLIYQIPLSGDTKPALLHLAYGFRRVEVYKAFAILAAFLAFPLLVTIWMGYVAIQSQKNDPSAAWFGFFRNLNFLLTASTLAWVTSGLGARRVIQGWTAEVIASRWNAVAADVLVTIGPVFLVYLLCMAAAYPVNARLRGSSWSQREFLLRQLATLGAKAIPLMFLLAALEMIRDSVAACVALSLFAVMSIHILKLVQLWAMKTYPQPLTSGELRDRVSAMASSVGVQLTQLYVLPTGKGLMANAFAAKNKVVIFTDYLLQKLTKREVLAVAAHELAHLRHNHPLKRGLAFAAAICLPLYFGLISGVVSGFVMIPLAVLTRLFSSPRLFLHLGSLMLAFEQWSQRDLVLILLGLTGFYMLSRHFENSADATALLVARDPEAQITGLLKLSRLNFTPIHWSKASESWSSHPSMLRRVKRIAAAGEVPPERLNQLLKNYLAGSPAEPVDGIAAVPADHFEVPDVNHPEVLRSAVRKRSQAQAKLWTLFFVYTITPVSFSLLVLHFHLEGRQGLAVRAIGVPLTAVLVTFVAGWFASISRGASKRRLLARFAKEGLLLSPGDVFVGLAPTDSPRIFGTKYYWDNGFLTLSQDRFQFVGECTRFALRREEIGRIVLGPGGPGWWPVERIYLSWNDAGKGRNGVFNVSWLQPGWIWSRRARMRSLYRHLQEWQQRPDTEETLQSGLAELESPSVGQVTNMSPKKLASLALNVKLLAQLLPLAIAVSILLQAEIWYVCSVICAVRFVQWVPLRLYKEKPILVGVARATDLTQAKAKTAAGASCQ
jgi:Zn-dependent protease with chaperone function